MYNFDYKKTTSVEEAASLLAANEDAKILAGGQTLLPTMKQRLAMPEQLIDISALAVLQSIAVSGRYITIGAGTCHSEVEHSELVKANIPSLAELAGGIGDPHVRNRGTLGGSVANNDPSADYPAACLALNARIQTNKAEYKADDFFQDIFETALDDDEIITSVSFQVPNQSAYVKFRNPSSRYAIVGVYIAHFADSVRVAVTGAAPCVHRHTVAEKALEAAFTPDAVKNIEVDPTELNSDLHADADYRAHLVNVMTRRAVEACL